MPKTSRKNPIPGQPIPEDRDMWERWPGETARAYEYFTAYLDAPTPRSYIAAWRSVHAGSTTYPDRLQVPKNVRDYADKWRWKERAEAYDNYNRQRDLKRRQQLLDTVVARTQDSIEELVCKINDIALGAKASMVQLKALIYQLQICGYDPTMIPRDIGRNGETAQDAAARLILYMPDNGRGPDSTL